MGETDQGRVFVVATPIGNLGDLSQRAVETLRGADLIACEDTRHTKKLLVAFNISTACLSLHEHNEHGRIPQLLGALAEGKQIAVVSDAGTPLISDPGFVFLRAAIAEGYPVEHLPGPCALIAALVLSGLPTDAFYFGGFLPSKSAKRCQELERLAAFQTTLVFYEAPHRLVALLRDVQQTLGNLPVVVGRELTKLHEELLRGSVNELLETLGQREQIKGECAVVIDVRSPLNAPTALDPEAILALMQHYVTRGDRVGEAAQRVAALLGCSKRDAYERWVARDA